jgi:VanZ family protein
MVATPRPAGRRSSASALAWAYAGLIVYASLYPFSGWRWPTGQDWTQPFSLPWLPFTDAFDLWSNVLGYLPFGLLLAMAQMRNGHGRWRAAAVALLVPAALSYAMEAAQSALPVRYPSLKDWALNVGGAALGLALALALQAYGAVERWHRMREEWFSAESGPALALLWLWPAALLFPAPVPLGLGQFDGRVRATLASWLEDVPGLEALHALLAAPSPAAASPPLPPTGAAEASIMALGLLAPCLVAYSIVAPGWRRIAMVFGALVLAAAGMTLSTWLNFGPRHALAWITPWAGPAVGVAVLIALVLAPLSRALVIGAGLIVLTGLVVGVAHAPPDPYFAQSLAAWEQGRFVRFHGIAQWIGWLWPYAAMGWLLSRLAGRN